MNSVKEVVDRGLQAWRTHDREAFAACYSDGAVISAPGDHEAHGKEGARAFMSTWVDAFPDNELTIEREYVVGNVLVQEGTFAGTHTGNLVTPDGQVIQPTGRSVRAAYADVFAVDGGLVTSEHLYFDRLELLTQIGVLPSTAATASV